MYLGDFLEDATIYIPFTTNAADGGRESFSASLEEADIVILKDGAAMTLDSSTITISLDLNSRVGFHVISVDMSNDTDFTTGAEYAALLYPSDETLDSQAPVGLLATWSCENRVADVGKISGDSTAADNLEAMYDGSGYTDDTAPASRSQIAGIGSGGTGALNYPVAFDNSTADTIDNAAAVDKGDGTVGIPVTGHAFVAGREVTIAGTTNYNGVYTIVSQTTNEVVITETFVSETFVGSETIVDSIEGVVAIGANASGTYLTTQSNTATYNQISHVGNGIDRVYAVDCGDTKTAIQIVIDAYLNSSNDVIDIQVYDHVDDSWETFSELSGTNGSTNTELTISLFERHTSPIGTDNAGFVYMRFVCSGQTSPALYVARIVTSAVGSTSTMGYEGGQVWVNEGAGSSTGTTLGVDGTFANQCDDFDNGQTIADLLDTAFIHNHPGTAVTLTAPLQGYNISNVQCTLTGGGGVNYTDSTRVTGGFIAGTWTRSGSGIMTFVGCSLTNVTSDRCAILGGSGLVGTFTLTEAGLYPMIDCQAAGPTGITTLDYASLGGATVNMERWSGNLTIVNMAAGDVLNLHSVCGGDIVLGGADGTVNISGVVGTVTDNRTGSPVLANDSVDREAINSEADTAISDAALATAAALTVAQNDLDTITGTDGVVIASGTQTFNMTGNVTGNLSGSVGSVTGDINTAAGTITSLDALDTAQDSQHSVTQGLVTVVGNNVGTAGAGLTDIPWHSDWDAEVQSEVTDALNAYDPPTAAELTSEINAVQADIAALNDIDGTGLTVDLNADQSSVTIGTVNAMAGTITTLDALDAAQDTQHATTQSKVDTIDGIVDAILVDTGTSLPSTLVTIASYIDTEVAAIKVVTDNLSDTLEDDGGTYRFTANALEEAPSGGGGGGDATAANQTTIIDAIAALNDIDGTGLTVDLNADQSSVTIGTASNVSADVLTVMQDLHLDHLLAVTYSPSSKPGVADALLNEIIVNDGGVSQFSTNALENAPGGVGSVNVDVTVAATAVTATSVTDAGLMTVVTYSDFSAALTGLGDLSDRSAIYFTVKENITDTDAEAIIQIDENTGLLILNGAAGTAGDGSISVTDEDAGELTIALEESATSELTVTTKDYYWSIKIVNSGGTVQELTSVDFQDNSNRLRVLSRLSTKVT